MKAYFSNIIPDIDIALEQSEDSFTDSEDGEGHEESEGMYLLSSYPSVMFYSFKVCFLWN